ncbi:MAG: hypothetical protein HC926_05915 [Synechococcaceae cyanobacterium SM2_3_60]|nr:hypothetical protein [Synechococcaceae cyanobacterium SM2_3_60]
MNTVSAQWFLVHKKLGAAFLAHTDVVKPVPTLPVALIGQHGIDRGGLAKVKIVEGTNTGSWQTNLVCFDLKHC